MTKEELSKIKWLKQYHYLKGRAADCERRIKVIKEDMYNKDLQPQRITSMPKGSGSPNNDELEKMLDQLDKVIHCEMYYKHKAYKRNEQIHKVICNSTDDQLSQWLLELRYLSWDERFNCPLTWEQIGHRIGYESTRVKQLHHKALSAIRIPKE
jgi:DNA-directed RNA polymerase sigma subunit (sigma70/sigma32)